MSQRVKYLVVVLAAWLLGLCWAISSPVGSSPDDDYHLASIYCATDDASLCRDLDGAGSEITVEVPAAVKSMSCYRFSPETSAECAESLEGQVVEVEWYNYAGQYPPTFYRFMATFAGANFKFSVLAIRMVALSVAMAVMALAVWVAPAIRDGQLVAWCVASVPLGMFILPSTNPSSWAIAGVAAMWPATHGLIKAEGVKLTALSLTAVVAAALLSTVRGDSAGLAAGVLGLGLICFVESRRQAGRASVGLLVCLLLLLVVRGSGQASSLSEGLTGYGSESGIRLLWSNLTDLPSLWAGAFGANWGLGWIDTEMPGFVWMPAIVAAAGLFLIGIAAVGVRRALVLAALSAALVLYPLLILQQSRALVGEGFQPRYLLPLIFVLMGAALSSLEDRAICLTSQQRWFVWLLLSTAASLALHVQLRRYSSGSDVISPALNQSAEWSYLAGISPQAIWCAGTLAAGILFWMVLNALAVRRELNRGSEQLVPELEQDPDRQAV